MTQRIGVVTASQVNVRPQPSTAQPPIASAERGTRMEILGQQGTWSRVRWGGAEGFVHGDYLREEEIDLASGFLHEQEGLRKVPLPPRDARMPRSREKMSKAQRAVATTWSQYGGLLEALAEVTGVEPGVAVAILQVESAGHGFNPDGRMVVRFENHVFERSLGAASANRFKRHFRYLKSKPWKRHEFCAGEGRPWESCHGTQAHEWKVFEFARQLHEPAALLSISMGAPQIMGFNHARIGHDSAREMFDLFTADLRYHVFGLFDFIIGPGTTSAMLEVLRRKRFEQFASFYNGPGQAARYGQRIQQFYDAFRSLWASGRGSARAGVPPQVAASGAERVSGSSASGT